MPFVVMTDTSGNLPPQYLMDYSLKIIPFSYFIDGKEYNSVKDPDFDAEDYYARIKKGMKVTTSQIPPQQYADFFEPALRDGKDVIFICMSYGISGSCNSARIAARMMMEAYPGRIAEVIDTRGASLGEGIIALYADNPAVNTNTNFTRLVKARDYYSTESRIKNDTQILNSIKQLTTYYEKFLKALENIDTGIKDLIPTLSQQNSVRYDLQGHRLSGQPMRGLYIIDGKKIMVR